MDNKCTVCRQGEIKVTNHAQSKKGEIPDPNKKQDDRFPIEDGKCNNCGAVFMRDAEKNEPWELVSRGTVG